MNQNTLAFSFKKTVKGFLIHLHANGYSTATIEIYRWGLAKFAIHFPDNIQEIEEKNLLTAFSSFRESGLKPASIQNIWTAMRKFFSWAEQELGLERLDKTIPCPKVAPPDIQPFSPSEVKRLLVSCKYSRKVDSSSRKPYRMGRATAHRDKAIILILLDTGLRVSELARLKIRDVDLETGQISIKAHGNGLKSKPRVVFIGKLSRSSLWRYIAGKEFKHDDFVFTSKLSKPMDRHSIRKVLQYLGKKEGIQNVYPHRFRHTFAIQYLRNGGDIYTLQRLLGHSSLEMVKRYLAIAKADCETAHRKASPVDNWKL